MSAVNITVRTESLHKGRARDWIIAVLVCNVIELTPGLKALWAAEPVRSVLLLIDAFGHLGALLWEPIAVGFAIWNWVKAP